LDQAVFTLSIAAGRGSTAQVSLVGPTAAIPLRGSIEVVDGGKNLVYGGIDRGEAVQLSGKFLRKSPPVTVRSAVRDPADWFQTALLASLADAGISVVPRGPIAQDGLVYEHATELGPALLRMLEESSNFDAEQCLRVLGAQAGDGSLQGGVAAMQALLVRELGALPADVVLADGSGLSKTNRLSPQVLLQVLLATQRGPGANLLRQTLPIAGQSGTLAERFLGSDLVGRVHAKTGWIRGASALSGYVGLRDGSRRWFVILMNYDPNKNGLNKDLKQLQERMVAAIENLPVGR
jgi:D-alanyl-D-alanine carboxypeptidase/D-alanyl-D-alanine-endopeptidase (penicillin-binding protein 4)